MLCGEACPLADIMRDGKPARRNVYLRHKNGHRVPVRIRAVPVRDAARRHYRGGGELRRAGSPARHGYAGAPLARAPLARAITGLLDGASTRSHLEAAVENLHADRMPFGVIAMAIDDLDRFQELYGRIAGESIVRAAARTLAASLGPDRYGGPLGWRTASSRMSRDARRRHSNGWPCALAAHGRPASIGWWGDRVSVTCRRAAPRCEADDTAETLLGRMEQALDGQLAAEAGTHYDPLSHSMFAIIGILVVFGAVVGGYLMEKGNMLVLLQPAELMIILGAAIGTVLIANPPHILKQIVSGIGGAFGGSKYNTRRYLESLKMMYDLFTRARKDGLPSLEADVEEPAKSKVLAAYPAFLKDHHACAFVCDTLRAVTSGTMEPFDLDQMMESDMDVHHHGASAPVASLSTMADSLPGLGIVAAVLGVVITMGALGGPPEEIGHKVAAALVGTFLGILLCYGLVGPLASSMAKLRRRRARLLPRPARRHHGVHQGHRADSGRGDRPARGSRPRPALLQGTGSDVPQPGSAGRRPPRRKRSG